MKGKPVQTRVLPSMDRMYYSGTDMHSNARVVKDRYSHVHAYCRFGVNQSYNEIEMVYVKDDIVQM